MVLFSTQPMVWLIDNDPLERAHYQACLTNTLLQVNSFNSLQGFLKAFNPGALSCIISEMFLPDGHGFYLQAQLLARHSKVPLIFIARHIDIRLAVKAMKQGAFNVLEKPTANNTLITVVQEAISYHQVHQGLSSNCDTTGYTALRVQPEPSLLEIESPNAEQASTKLKIPLQIQAGRHKNRTIKNVLKSQLVKPNYHIYLSPPYAMCMGK